MFSLAEHLGMTKAELGQRMSSGELTEWKAWHNENPWSRDRLDFMLGQIAFYLFNSWRGKDDPFRKLSEFMPYVKTKEPEQSPSEQILRLKAALPPKK